MKGRHEPVHRDRDHSLADGAQQRRPHWGNGPGLPHEHDLDRSPLVLDWRRAHHRDTAARHRARALVLPAGRVALASLPCTHQHGPSRRGRGRAVSAPPRLRLVSEPTDFPARFLRCSCSLPRRDIYCVPPMSRLVAGARPLKSRSLRPRRSGMRSGGSLLVRGWRYTGHLA